MIVSNLSEIPEHVLKLPEGFLPPEKRPKKQPGPVDFSILGEQQMKIAEEIISFLEGAMKNYRMYCVMGYAGTGKSFLMGLLENYMLYAKKLKVAATAPTNKAVQVCKDMCEIDSPQLDFATIHSLLGLRPNINARTGKQEFKPDPMNVPRLDKYNVLIIDEVSMLDDELFLYIDPFVEDYNLKIIFVGDNAQIPPVGKHDCLPFSSAGQRKYKIKVGQLTEVRRQALDSPILAYATAIRDQRENKQFQYDYDLCFSEKSNMVPIKKGNKDIALKILETFYCNDYYREYPDFMKVITWRNKTADGVNNTIRRLIYGIAELPTLLVGEKMYADEPAMHPVNKNLFLLTTNQEFEVLDFIERETSALIYIDDVAIVNDVYRYYETTAETMTTAGKKTVDLRILHKDDVERYEKNLKLISAYAFKMDKFARIRAWKAYYELKNMFHKVRYNYAITAHKAQGSTYVNTLMLEWDMLDNNKFIEANRIRYVAASRPTTNLFTIIP